MIGSLISAQPLSYVFICNFKNQAVYSIRGNLIYLAQNRTQSLDGMRKLYQELLWRSNTVRGKEDDRFTSSSGTESDKI